MPLMVAFSVMVRLLLWIGELLAATLQLVEASLPLFPLQIIGG